MKQKWPGDSAIWWQSWGAMAESHCTYLEKHISSRQFFYCIIRNNCLHLTPCFWHVVKLCFYSHHLYSPWSNRRRGLLFAGWGISSAFWFRNRIAATGLTVWRSVSMRGSVSCYRQEVPFAERIAYEHAFMSQVSHFCVYRTVLSRVLL